MSTRIETAVERLESAAADGSLAELCRRYEVSLLVLFGSALIEPQEARDLDIAAWFSAAEPDLWTFLDALAEVAGTDVDLLQLNHAGPVVREQALLNGLLLYESRGGEMANARIAAMMERIETAPMRRLDLQLLADADA